MRAEDSQTTGTGPCNSGNQDTNVVERSAVPGGPSATVTDNVESGSAYWTTAGGTGANLWNIVTTAVELAHAFVVRGRSGRRSPTSG